jgi:peptidoglycan/xylan/chitin deacetylase (PgdA/CDA1 family)
LLSLPPAGSYPIVDSCDPASVPWATPVTSAIPKLGPFTLHVPVLEYHRIVPTADAGDSERGLVVPPATFTAQLDALAQAGWSTITLTTLNDYLAAHRLPPPKSFAITLDDGWEDGYTYALPILQAHGFVATFFVIGSRIDTPAFLSTRELLALQAAGDEVGDHTMNHVSLSRVASAEARREIESGAARIAQATGRWPDSLAYPYGGVSDAVAGIVAGCQGMRIAVLNGPLKMTYPAPRPARGASPATPRTVELEAYETAGTRYAVPRIKVGPGTRPEALLALLTAIP